MTRRPILMLTALLALATPAAAQPPRFVEIAKAIAEQQHLPSAPSDDQRRAVTVAIAEQLTFEFPNQGWGAKSAEPGRPISKDCVAKVEQLAGSTIVRGGCYEWWDGNALSGRVAERPVLNDIPGQNFIAVAPVDHLGAGGASSGDRPAHHDEDQVSTVRARIDALESRLTEAHQAVAALEQRVTALEQRPADASGSSTSSGDVTADVRRIRELLEAVAKRFGVQ